MKWDKVKRDIQTATQSLNSMDNWKYRYSIVRDRFNETTQDNLLNIATNDTDIRVRQMALNRYRILDDYNVRTNFDECITLKLFIPSSCNAKCKFCYMNDYNKSELKDAKLFLTNFLDSITKLILKVDGKYPISLDITGNEPTFDIELLKEVLHQLRNYKYKSSIARITITTNGFNLSKVINDFYDVIDYVNISVHHYNCEKRKSIFGCNILTDNDYENLVLKLYDKGIDTSAVAVIHENITDFKNYLTNFISYCKNIGFTSLRLRNDVFWTESKFLEYMQIGLDNYKVIQHENTNDAEWCRLIDNEGFTIFFLKGVIDTSIVSKGIEYVINDDGLIYTDFYKRTKLDDYEFPVKFIFDKK